MTSIIIFVSIKHLMYSNYNGQTSNIYYMTNHNKRLIDCDEREIMFAVHKKYVFENGECHTFPDDGDLKHFDDHNDANFARYKAGKKLDVNDIFETMTGGEIYKFLKSIAQASKIDKKSYALRIKFTLDQIE